MPTYEYECSQCGETFEAFQSMKENPLTTCLHCGAEGSVKRLIGAGAGLIFKGSGFYVTDYKKNGSGNGSAKPADGKSESKGAEKSEAKADTGAAAASASGSSSKTDSGGSTGSPSSN